MALDILTLDNGITFQGKGGTLTDALVVETCAHNDLMENHKEYKSTLDYTDTTLLNPDQKFSSRLPNGGLKSVEERGTKAIRDLSFGPKKGLSQREIGEKFTNSYLFSKWARTAKNIKGASDSVQAELADSVEQSRDLIQGYDISYAEEMVLVLSKGFSVSSAVAGPGSACARDGLPLFSAGHELKTGENFSNLITGAVDFADVASGAAKLQEHLDYLKTVKLDNGKKMVQPKGVPYKIFCSRLRENYWLEVINNGSDKAGTGNNSAKENTFSFRNNLVQVVVLDLLGDIDANGDLIGTDDMFFVSNPTAVKKMKALRCANLYSPMVKTYMNDETDEMNTSIRAIVGAGHYDLEFCMSGSTGV